MTNLYIYFIIVIIFMFVLTFVIESKINKISELLTKPKEKTHHLITFQRPNESPKSVFYDGNIATFILIEREMGRDTTLLNVLEVSAEDYNKATYIDNKLERMKKNSID